MPRTYLPSVPVIPTKTDASPATPAAHAADHNAVQDPLMDLSQEVLDARGSSPDVPTRLTTMTAATTTAQSTATSAASAAAAAQATANLAAVDTTVMKKANSLSDVSSVDSALANLGINDKFDGVEQWVVAHSMGSTGGSSVFSTWGQRLSNQLHTIGRIARNTMELTTAPIYGNVPLNSHHDVEFSEDNDESGPGGAFANVSNTYPLRFIPRNNAVFLGTASTDKFPGFNNFSWPTYPIQSITNRMMREGYTPGLPGVLFFMVSRNNWYYYGTDAGSVTAYKDTLRTMLRFAAAAPATSASVGIHDFSGSGGLGGWSSISPIHAYNNTTSFTSNTLDYQPVTFTGDAVVISVAQFDNGIAAGDIAIQSTGYGANYVSQYSTTGGYLAGLSPSDNFYFKTHRLTGFGAGSHTVWVVKYGPANPVALDAWWTPSIAPPLCVIVKEGDAGETGYSTYMTAIDTIAAEAEFTPYVMTVDCNVGWNNSSMTLDAVHPNDRGHAHITKTILRSLATNATWRDGTHVLSS